MINSTLPYTGIHSKLFVRLFRRDISRSVVLQKRIFKYPKTVTDEALEHPKIGLSIDGQLFNTLKGNVIYNCLVTKKNRYIGWYLRKKQLNRLNALENTSSLPYSLKYKFGDSVYEFEEYRNAVEGDSFSRSVEENKNQECSEECVNFPYSVAKEVQFQSDTEHVSNNDENIRIKLRKKKFNDRMQDLDPPNIVGKKWMSDYEVFEEGVSDEAEVMNISQEDYGTPDPHILPTNIPCGGCGAHLHCQNPSVPGYLPKEIFIRCKKKDFYRISCQRCLFLKHYNLALSVFVDPNSYPKLLSSLKNKTCCIVLVVDMTDLPCSIWPNILDVIGHEKPILLVGNKIDLIPGDCPGWLTHAENILRKSFRGNANIIGTCLISAKTGYGVETLITKLHSKWRRNGDVYIVGCTNVGKSSLFNDLISSDYCRSKAVDLMQRATVSPWPGTTLNLLKFPIFRLEGWRAYLRNERLKNERKFRQDEHRLEILQKKDNHEIIPRLPKITGEIGRTFRYQDPKKKEQESQEFLLPKLTNKFLKTDERPFLDPNDEHFKNSKWCYDTPGVIHRDQIIDLLTINELNDLTTDSPYHARIFSIYPGQTLFIGGLARMDLIETEKKFVRFIVYSSPILPITVCWTHGADEVYNTLLGTEFMKVPNGSLQRLEKWPALKSNESFEISGEGHSVNTSEIVLSSAGWMSFTSEIGKKFKVKPWTPDGRGIHLRKDPLLRYTIKQRRSRLSGTPTYSMNYLI